MEYGAVREGKESSSMIGRSFIKKTQKLIWKVFYNKLIGCNHYKHFWTSFPKRHLMDTPKPFLSVNPLIPMVPEDETPVSGT